MGKKNSKQKGNITVYKKPFQINLGLIIFFVIFIYILIMVIMYVNSKHIVGYEVKTGQLTVSNIYKGLALRDEEIVLSKKGGYISYFIPEATRVAVGGIVCAIDNGNELESLLLENTDGSSGLGINELNELKEKMKFFKNNFQSKNFNSVYDLKKDLEISVSKYLHLTLKEKLNKANNDSGLLNIGIQTSEKTGIIVYNMDGFEDTLIDNIENKDFEMENYNKTDFISNELILENSPIYKIILKELWSVVIKVDEERIASLKEGDYIKVRFLKNQNESWAQIHQIKNENGMFIELKFTNSMITFSKDRFVDLELLTEEEEGLKIPNSSKIEKTFFLIPKEYVYIEEQGSKKNHYVMLEYYNEDGIKSIKKLLLNVYSESDTEYYIDSDFLDYGNKLLKENSVETFIVNKIGTLIGVYNINKGYADFTQITILYSNEEYSIVKSNTKYGLSDYDYIVLDAQMVEDDDLLY